MSSAFAILLFLVACSVSASEVVYADRFNGLYRHVRIDDLGKISGSVRYSPIMGDK